MLSAKLLSNYLLKIVLISLFLIIFTSACGTATVVTREVLTPVYPSELLTRETPVPVIEGNTYLDVLNYTFNLKAGLDAANQDKKSIREWVEESKNLNGDK